MPSMPTGLDPRLLRGVCIYQDLVLGGTVAIAGRRDCRERWALLAPHLPASGAVLDVGSNLGWFGLRMCQHSPEVVVASVEADWRSAALQRAALAAASHQRIALLTSPAGVRMARVFALRGQRFAAALCLSVLHWMPRHRQFLQLLGSISDRLLIEHPDPREEGAGHDYLRRQIGPIGPYLQELFPERPVVCLGETAGYRSPSYPRSVWMVGPACLVDKPPGDAPSCDGLDVQALLALGLSWPPRSWWREQLKRVQPCADNAGVSLRLTSRGLEGTIAGAGGRVVRARLLAVPEKAVLPWWQQLRHWARAVRRLPSKLLRCIA